MEAKTEVIVVEQNALAKYEITPEKVAELVEKYKNITVAPGDKETYKKAKSGKMALVHVINAVDKRRKQLGADLREELNRINSAGKQLMEPMIPVRDHLDSQLKAEDDRLEAVEAEKIRQNQERIDKILRTIDGIKGIPLSLIGKSAVAMQEQIELFLKWELTETEFQEFLDEAQEVKSLVLDTLNNQRMNRIEMDREDTERKAEAERLEKVRLEQEAEGLRLEEARKFQEAEQRLLREAEDKRRIEEEERLAAGRKAFEDEQRRVREEHEEKVRTEEERINEARRQVEEEAGRIEAEKRAEQERKDREAFERKAQEDARIKAEQEAKEKAAREEQERKNREESERIERERQEALKPDKGKLCAWADSLATMPIPKGLTTVEGKDLMIELDGKLTGLIVEIRVRANGL